MSFHLCYECNICGNDMSFEHANQASGAFCEVMNDKHLCLQCARLVHVWAVDQQVVNKPPTWNGEKYSITREHFKAAEGWDNASEALGWAWENGATVAEMKAWRLAVRGENMPVEA